MRELETSWQQFGEFLLKAQLLVTLRTVGDRLRGRHVMLRMVGETLRAFQRCCARGK